jgi:selenocysteine lyase/cysteine desulfurase
MMTSLFPEPTRRKLFPVVDKWVYLAASAETPLCTPAWEAMEAFFQRHRQEGMGGFKATLAELQLCRERICQLIGAENPENVALVPNTTAGAAAIAHSLNLKPKDRVVTNELEFPSNLWPWEDAATRAGAEVLRLPVPQGFPSPELLQAYLQGTDQEALRAVTWSWVQYRDGYRVDLARLAKLCQEAGAFFAVDGIQGLGVVPFDLKETPVDALYAGGHKWLLGQGGGGFLWVHPKRVSGLRDFGRGWLSVEDPMAMDPNMPPRGDARRFEAGSMAFGSYYALSASLKLLLEVGVKEIHIFVQHLQDHLLRALEGSRYTPASPQERSQRSAILTLDCPQEDVDILVAALAEKGILCTARKGRLRIAPHLYNSIEEMDLLATALRDLEEED